ncbi:MAG: tetratricopeptide repeat protein [Treponema sp.]|nr:tetratricopeptide repeat protein [Treponema sp.]
MIIPILLAVIVGGALLLVLMSRAGSSEKKTKRRTRQKSQSTIIKECTKRLSHDPHNVPALTALSDIYYAQKDWEKALPLYQTLFELSSLHVEIDQVKVSVRNGICAFKMAHYDQALQVLLKAQRLAPDGFEQNYYLGYTLYEMKEYKKAIACLKKALLISPEAMHTYEPLAFACYKAKSYKEALPYLRRVLDEHPDNKEALFYTGIALSDSGQTEKALKVFTHLRLDPTFGAPSCLEAGGMHVRARQYEAALQDYQIGLKLENTAPDVKVQLLYNIANTYIAMNDISKGLACLTKIQELMPNYKDVTSLIQRYQELNQNSNLQTYLLSGINDFVALCRNFVTTFYKDASVKIEDITVSQGSVDVLCNIDTPKWEDTELFRFFRTTGSTGELFVRDFHAKLRDVKCDRGFCITAGTFTEEAKKYVDGRPIDLIEKQKLIMLLKAIRL